MEVLEHLLAAEITLPAEEALGTEVVLSAVERERAVAAIDLPTGERTRGLLDVLLRVGAVGF